MMATIECYLDAAPRQRATAEDLGPLTLFVGESGGFPFYARPRPGAAAPVGPADIDAVRTRQRELGVPESFEWVVETSPTMAAACLGSGLRVTEYPLLALGTPPTVRPPAGARVELLDRASDAGDLAAALAV
ncbi:MAG: acetyltransferase, partial [Acidimicrobiales bacterium]|nr:acetyltransferase [Acidimicrobiales bacterium]